MYDINLLTNVKQIYLYVSGKENKLGNLASKFHGNSMVLGGLEYVPWNKHHFYGQYRANSLDLAFVILYQDYTKIAVLGEVEGNKGSRICRGEGIGPGLQNKKDLGICSQLGNS